MLDNLSSTSYFQSFNCCGLVCVFYKIVNSKIKTNLLLHGETQFNATLCYIDSITYKIS